MLAPDVRDDAELRLDHLHQRRQFAGMIRADFQHGGLMRCSSRSNVTGTPMSLLKLASLHERRKFLPQHRGDQFFGRRLAVRTADRDDRQRKLSPIRRARVWPNACPRIRHLDHRTPRQRFKFAPPLDQDGHRAFLRDFGNEIVPVKLLARQRNEQIARLGLPRIRVDALKARCRRTLQQFSGTRLNRKC